MKSRVKKILQRMLGFDNYLFIFSIFVINTLRWNKKEGDFLQFLKQIQDGTTILDVGANIGIMTVWLAKKKPNSTIIAFEPMPQNIKALKRVLKFYNINNVKIVEKALGNQTGHVEMVMPVLEDVKMQGLSHVVHESITVFNEGNAVNVPILKLDDCPELNGSISSLSAIKLDVENFEYFVLKGGEKLIQRFKPLIYTELWENENRTSCFNLMRNLGYNIQVLQQNKLVNFQPETHHTQNFFFVP
jgi:FkbM family methyltransferase